MIRIAGNLVKITATDDYVYLDGKHFKFVIGEIVEHKNEKFADFKFRMNVQTITEGKNLLLEFLKNFIENLYIKIDKSKSTALSSNLKWIVDRAGVFLCYVAHQQICRIYQTHDTENSIAYRMVIDFDSFIFRDWDKDNGKELVFNLLEKLINDILC